MTFTDLSTVKPDTRVILADGSMGQFKGALKRSETAAVFVFKERGVRYVPIASLRDLRATEGELRQVQEVTA